MEGNKIFPNDIFRDRIRPPRIYCSCRVRILHPIGEEGMHDIKGENMCHLITYRLYVLRNVTKQKKLLLNIATSFSLRAP